MPDIREFLTGERIESVAERVLSTVLFTDLVASTDRAARMGDEAWRGLLETHHAAARREIGAHRGIEVGSAGDGFLARFDGPGRAIRCAAAILDDAARQGLEVRAGVHTGEVELVGDDIAGLSVHIGARIAPMAGPGEILASGSVRDISAGSGVSFLDLGERELRGVPGSWRVCGRSIAGPLIRVGLRGLTRVPVGSPRVRRRFGECFVPSPQRSCLASFSFRLRLRVPRRAVRRWAGSPATGTSPMRQA